MGNIAKFSIEKPLYTWMLVLVCLLGGLVGIDNVPRLEDPAFPIKNALIITSYPGASAEEVEQEVTDVIEASLQELPYLDEITSKSVDGRSEVQVELLEHFGAESTPQIFDELRRRITEAAGRLPPGAGVPLVEDDFGDVYGIMYAVSAPDYSAAEIRDISRTITTALKSVPHVAKVQTAGEPFEAVYVEIEHSRLASLGLPIDGIFSSLSIENQVVPAGSVAYLGRRLRIAPQMAFDSEAAVGEMRIGSAGTVQTLRLADIADIRREQIETPPQIIRHNGKPVFTVGVSVVGGENVVEIGKAVDAKMQQVLRELPLGVDVNVIYAQHEVVEESIRQFMQNLILSVLTVVLALCVFMGWRAGAVVGTVLLLTVLGTIGLMSFFGIALQRISLGALMIAMGMLVDNGIVIAEGMVIGVRRGLTPAEAAAQSVGRTQYALLGATIIGIVAFGPISLSNDNSGHFLRSLFQVVALSLLLSWVLAISVVPLFGKYLLRSGKEVNRETDGGIGNEGVRSDAHLYQGILFAPYRLMLRFGLRYAWLSVLIIIGITASCLWAFQFVQQGFFPKTNTPLYYVDYRLPEGSDILTTQVDVLDIEAQLSKQVGVEGVTSFIGRGATRFTTIMKPEQPNPAYAQMVVRVGDVEQMNDMMNESRAWLVNAYPDAEVQVTRAEFTPSGSSKIEARFSGPDATVLRGLAEQTLDLYLQHDLPDRKTDWRQPVMQLVPVFDKERAQLAGVTRSDLSQALAFATFGVQVGLYREADKLLPIVARAPMHERGDIENLLNRMVWSPTARQHTPMSQIVSSIELQTDNATIFRRDRQRTIKAQANPPLGDNPTATFNRIRGDIEAIELPVGYKLEWGGEYEASKQADATITQRIPLAFGIMFFITILMFGRLKQPIIIWLTVPMTICGVVLGLLATDLAFTFPSFLGFLSLSGMLIKNCIVLVDEIDKRFDEIGFSIDTMIEASISRLRPVLLATGTTIAGMAPLLGDAFFLEMAVCIMAGLAFATLLTLMAVPVFYRLALGRKIAFKGQS